MSILLNAGALFSRFPIFQYFSHGLQACFKRDLVAKRAKVLSSQNGYGIAGKTRHDCPNPGPIQVIGCGKHAVGMRSL